MWVTILLFNSIILTIVSTYLVYSIGAAILLSEWRQLVITFILFIFFSLVEIALGAIAEP